MEEQEIKEQVKDLQKSLAKIDVSKSIEIIGIQLMLFETAVHMTNLNINNYFKEKMKNKENKESEEK